MIGVSSDQIYEVILYSAGAETLLNYSYLILYILYMEHHLYVPSFKCFVELAKFLLRKYFEYFP